MNKGEKRWLTRCPGCDAELPDMDLLRVERDRYRKALERLRDCDWVITLPDRMDAVRQIARDALIA